MAFPSWILKLPNIRFDLTELPTSRRHMISMVSISALCNVKRAEYYFRSIKIFILVISQNCLIFGLVKSWHTSLHVPKRLKKKKTFLVETMKIMFMPLQSRDMIYLYTREARRTEEWRTIYRNNDGNVLYLEIRI